MSATGQLTITRSAVVQTDLSSHPPVNKAQGLQLTVSTPQLSAAVHWLSHPTKRAMVDECPAAEVDQELPLGCITKAIIASLVDAATAAACRIVVGDCFA
jgi:hypothetical protein